MGMLNALMAADSLDKLSQSFFSAGNPTPGTGIASTDAPTSFSATVGLINIYNAADPANGEHHRVIPIGICLRALAVNTGATSFVLIGYEDNINRYSSGGTALTENNLYMTSQTGWTTRTAKAAVHFGVLTLAAASASVKKVFNQQISDVIYAADDTVMIWFGEGATGENGNRNNIVLPPIYLGPGGNLSIHELAASQSADPGFEVDIWWAETGHDSILAI